MITREYRYGNATVIVHRPVLTEKEYRMQEERVLVALQQYGKEIEENRKHGNINQSRNFRK